MFSCVHKNVHKPKSVHKNNLSKSGFLRYIALNTYMKCKNKVYINLLFQYRKPNWNKHIASVNIKKQKFKMNP